MTRRSVLKLCFATCVAASNACASSQPAYRSFDNIDYGYDREQTIRSSRARINIRIAELGPVDSSRTPVVLLHPWGTNMLVWRTIAPELAVDRRVILIDLPGHGKSGKPPGRYPPARLAQSVVDVLDALGIERAVLIGNSLGGATALQVALTYPDRVAAQVLISAPGAGLVAAPIRSAIAAAVTPNSIASISPLANRLFWWVTSWSSDPITARLHDDWYRARTAAEWQHYCRATSASFVAASNWQPAVEDVQAPSLVVVGTADVIVWPWLGRRLAARIAGAELAELPGCSHMPMFDCRASLLARVRPFLARH